MKIADYFPATKKYLKLSLPTNFVWPLNVEINIKSSSTYKKGCKEALPTTTPTWKTAWKFGLKIPSSQSAQSSHNILN